MASKLVPSSPSDVMVIRDVTPNVVTFSVPFLRFGKIPIGGRGTLVKLTSGSLAIFSPVALTPEAKAKVDSLGGQVRYIIAPDIEHHIFISEWAKAYPEAVLIGPEGLPEKRAKMRSNPSNDNVGEESFATVFTKTNKLEVKVSPEFDADFEYEYVDAHPNKELVFFYKPDKVLIEADLMFNLPAEEQYSRMPESEKPKNAGFLAKAFMGAQSTEGDAKWMKRFIWYALSRGDRTGFNESVKRIGKWDFETIVPCHGETIVGGGKAVFEKVRIIPRGPAATAKSLYSKRVHRDMRSPPFTLAVKDNIATTTSLLATTCASPILKTYTSPIEATIVAQLRKRGGVVVGKTNLDEFGMGSHSTHSFFGPVAQGPFSAGGSSGGSAVAVSQGDAEIALGTDTGGSVRLPASYTGVVGYKPSYGMISRYGVIPYANSLDTVGFLSRSVQGIHRLVVGGGLWAVHDAKDPTSLSTTARRRCASVREGYSHKSAQKGHLLEGITFGLPLEYNIAELDGSIRHAWADAAKKLQALGGGVRVVPVSLPSTRHALSAYYVIAPAEASSNLAKYDGVRYGTQSPPPPPTTTGSDDVLYSAVRGQGFGPEVKRRILLGSYTLSSEAIDNYFLQAQKVRRLVRRDFDRVFRLSNPLLGGSEEEEAFDLSDLPEEIPMENKFGPTEVDFLLCPTAPTLAPRLGDVLDDGEEEGKKVVDAYVNDVFTVPASLAGLPAISIPVPVQQITGNTGGDAGSAGLQLIGQYWDDARLLSVAAAVMECLGGDGEK
ncbi:glutamyl-tRNA amidotransferase [Rhypophila decipiens]|uniref:Glutamyl-tRNA(Gln) amidotransferase subunit A, mitochondrial n=1 Tax=Rhypophila decipiens TaxID=261697 RepID=A0AAN6Y785_9PEZI|nr:glutamyl-tRNA amidotransferase [Rhypophila decipiens]